MDLQYRDRLILADGTRVTIRPISPDDAEINARFVRLLSPESRYQRFLYALDELTPALLERFTTPQFPQEAALIAVIGSPGAETEIGVARFAAAHRPRCAEFAVVVADAWQGMGIATRMMQALLEVVALTDYQEMIGLTLAGNRRMLALTASLGFEQQSHTADPTLIELRKQVGADYGEPTDPAGAGVQP